MVLRWLAAAFVFFAWGIDVARAQDCLPPACTAFPPDAGFLNVRDFGAKGDGVSDDTQAINAALAASGKDAGRSFWQDKIVYFPDGTYLVSAPLAKRYADGHFGSGAILIGQSRDGTIIRLADHAPGYSDAASPKPIVFTASKLLDNGSATSGGKDYNNKGEGNDAYANFIETLTVDAGTGNAGAIGIDYLANNLGAIRHVRVKAQQGSGATGIALTRKWPGPALLEDVSIEGFNTGIDVANTEYGITMDHIRLIGQRGIGLRNNHNEISGFDVNVKGVPQPVVNASPDGLIVIDGGTLSGNGDEAIRNAGYMNIRYLTLEGYHTAFGTSTNGKPIDGVYQGNNRISPSSVSWSLPVKNPPAVPADPVKNWVSVARFDAQPDSGLDATDAIRKAFASGASTVYFPHGTYLISDSIVVPSSVQRIVGMMSTLRQFTTRQPGYNREQGMLRAANDTAPLTIEHLTFDNTDLGHQVAVEADGGKPLVLRDVVGAGTVTLKRTAHGGEAFLEDTCCGTIDISGPAGVWARQLNSEGSGTRVTNNGAPLWVLGLKTEQDCTVIDNRNGAHTEMLGGLLYIVRAADSAIPAFRNTDSKLLVSYVEEAYNPAATYHTHVINSRQGQQLPVKADMLPARNAARMVPQLVSE